MRALEDNTERVLVFAPIGRDGSATAELLQRGGIDAKLCANLTELVKELEVGAAAVFVAEEGLYNSDIDPLLAWARRSRHGRIFRSSSLPAVTSCRRSPLGVAS